MTNLTPSVPVETIQLGNRAVWVYAAIGHAVMTAGAAVELRDAQGASIGADIPTSACRFPWQPGAQMVLFLMKKPDGSPVLVATKCRNDSNPTVFSDGIANCIPAAPISRASLCIAAAAILAVAAAPVLAFGAPAWAATALLPLVLASVWRDLCKRRRMFKELKLGIRTLDIRAGYLRQRDHAKGTFEQMRPRLTLVPPVGRQRVI